jgi:glycosyltransferase involved in cell wall biosynthesis
MILSLIIPTYNEEKIIENTIKVSLKHLKELGHDYELIIADDCSEDRTREIVEALKSKNENLDMVAGSVNRGRGEAVSEGFLKAKGDVLAFMDADLSTDLKHLPQLISYVQDDFDIAIGSRWKDGNNTYRSAFRLITSFVYNSFVKIVFVSKIQDHECGFKSFDRDVGLDLIKRIGIKKGNERGVAWDTEILLEAQRRGYKIKEFPVKWKESKKSEIRILRESMKVLKYLLRLRIRYWKENRFKRVL